MSDTPEDKSTEATPGPKTTTIKKTIKVKSHPNAYKYPGQRTMDFMKAQMRFISSLTDEQRELAGAGLLIQNLDGVEAFVSSLELKDVIGVGVDMLEVRSKGDFTLDGWNPRTKTMVSLGPSELDEALVMGLLEILYRNEKPYGVADTKEVTVTIVDHRQPNSDPPTPAQS